MENKKKHIITIGIIILFLIGILGYFVIFIEMKFFSKKRFLREGMKNNDLKKEKEEIQKEIKEMGLEPHLGFCENNRNSGKAKEEACNKLSKENCGMTSCCVYTDEEKCVAGSSHGTLFKTKDGVPLKVETYHHYGKCYGKNC